MNKLIRLLFPVFCLFQLGYIQAQDTTWVQTFTFDTIANRRATFLFPTTLNTKRFEKVLMYYKLKCSPLTPWDQYDCGEWDYLTYARVFDHTGNYDSVQVDGFNFEVNITSPDSIDYLNWPSSKYDQYTYQEKNRAGATLIDYPINTSTSSGVYPFVTTSFGNRMQMLLTAAELAAAGVAPGDIQSLGLYVSALSASGELKYPIISIKPTALSQLTSFETSGFTEVYRASHGAGSSQSALFTGFNSFLFYQPFTWNGTDNLIIEFIIENPEPGTSALSFLQEDIAANTTLFFDQRNGYLACDATNYTLSALSDFTVGDEMTITFWAKGTGSIATNTSVLEAYDTLNNRIINIHLPWSDNNLYFDAGNGGGSYDRISKGMSAAEIDNNWNHWAFVKKKSTGEMLIYKNGVLWHSGTGKNQQTGYVHRLKIGANANGANNWNGKLDEFQFYNAALDATTIQNFMNKKPDGTHPFIGNLMAYYDFDGGNWVEDRSGNGKILMPSENNMQRFDEYPLVNVLPTSQRPVITLGQGTVAGALQVSNHLKPVPKEPAVLFQYQPVNRHFEISAAGWVLPSGGEITYDLNGDTLTNLAYLGTTKLKRQKITYYQQPFEIVKDVEIGRYITPYGIGFDLGPNGFSYIYDVTDYQMYLKNAVDFAAHNTQELIDVRFAFIEGVPPRDVLSRQPIWNEWRSYNYGEMGADVQLKTINIPLAANGNMYKIKTRLSGHGQVGNGSCCEWVPKNHGISVDGINRFNWQIWQDTECGDNPNTAQGGTWPYAREGWCPGDMVRENEFELTPYVTPGTSVNLDYTIDDVPANDAGQAGGNYIVAMDLITYSPPNFQHDAAVLDVLNPNNYEYYKKFNPTCSYPRVLIQNTGASALTQATIRCWITPDRTIDFNWTGNLPFLGKEIVEIPVTDINWWHTMTGSHTFTAQIVGIEQGAFMDEYASNNAFSNKFESPDIISGKFFVWFTTNNKASENSYKLIKDNGDVVFERTSLANATQYKDTFDLQPGCYSIILEDTDHDGIAFWASAQYEGETSGSFRLRYPGGSVFKSFSGDFGHYLRYNFSIGLDNLNVEEIDENNNLFVYPNPTDGEFYVDLGGNLQGEAHLTITDIEGRVVLKQQMDVYQNHADLNINLKHVPAGMYLVSVQTGQRVYVKQLLKK